MNFFHKESRSLAGGGGVEEVNFFNKESKTYLRKKKKIFFCVCEWGGGGGKRGRWIDRRTGPNQFAPSTSSKLGA